MEHTDWVDVAPVRFRLRMYCWITVHFWCAGDQNFCTNTFRQTEYVYCANCICFDRFDGIVHVMRWRGWTRQMVNFIDFDEQWIDDIMVNEFEVFMTQPMLDISFTASEKIIRNDDFMPLHH